MGTITSGIGLISGINTADIIDKLMQLEQAPKNLLQSRIDKITSQKTAYTSIQTKLASLRLSAQALKKIGTFNNAAATSGNENILTATAASGATVGSYQFQVARLVTTQQSVSAGFADFDKSPVGAGSITIEMGGGELRAPVALANLNGGAGVQRGSFRITDRSGQSAVIDTSDAVTLDDVVKKINSALDVNIKAEVSTDGLTLTDLTGGTGALTIQDLAGGSAAADLGIAQSVSASTLTGTSINKLGRGTALALLNDGRGVNTAAQGTDFTVTTASGTSYDVSLKGIKTVGQLLDKLNTLAPSDFHAAISSDGKGLQLVDTSGGSGTLNITPGASSAASDLGLTGAAINNTLTGSPLLSGLNTVSLASLRGGSGISLGQVAFTNRAGASTTLDFTGAKSVQDILDTINNSGLNLQASLKDSLNGIQIVDQSGGSGNLTIADTDSTTAQELGIAGSYDLASQSVQGANMQRQWVTRNTRLSTYNGGKGVSPGTFSITNAQGSSATIDLSNAADMTIGDVIDAINARGIGVTASINANGDGIMLSDTTGGSGKLKVQDVSGTAAANMRIAGTAEDTTIDGSFEVSIDISDTDTLADVQKKISTLGFGLSANIINDGSGVSPYRLSLTAFNSGQAGRVIFDSGSVDLGVKTLISAQDAAVFLGSQGSQQPLMITSSSNQITGVIPGVTLDLHGVSSAPVNLTISRNVDNVVDEIQKYSDGFNELIDSINSLTKYDSDTNTPGLLLGDSAVQQIQNELYASFMATVNGAGRYKLLADVGIKLADGAKIEFDEDKFRAAYASDPDSVTKLFTAISTTTDSSGKTVTNPQGLGYIMEQHLTRLIDPVNGVIPQGNVSLDAKTQQFQSQIDSMTKLLDAKKLRLQTQFANMESVLAKLQSQQQALSSLQLMSYNSSSSSKK